MGTVLWANHLDGDRCTSDQQDLLMLYSKRDWIDAVCKEANVPPMSEMIDQTDFEVNRGLRALPDGMDSTTDLMIRNGVWTASETAIARLQTLRDHMVAEKPRMGFFRDHRPAILEELDEVIAFATRHSKPGTQFNFCVVT